MPRRRTKVTDYIEVKHVYHPGTGQLLGVFAIDDIPADPKKLIAFVRRKVKAANSPLEKVEPQIDDSDGWDYLRKQSWWFQVVDPGFWKQRQTALELLPFGISGDLNGLHNPRRPGSAEDCDSQLWRDRLKEHALLATHKLTGFDTCSDPLNALLDILKSNPKYGGTTTLVSGASGEQRIEKRYVRCIRTGLQALYSALATQALENEVRLVRLKPQQLAPATAAQAEKAQEPVLLSRSRTAEPVEDGRSDKKRRGDLSLLEGKTTVRPRTAASYVGVTERRIQQAIQDKKLEATGRKGNRMVTVDSLTRYQPPLDAK